jgi:hypothetical protein
MSYFSLSNTLFSAVYSESIGGSPTTTAIQKVGGNFGGVNFSADGYLDVQFNSGTVRLWAEDIEEFVLGSTTHTKGDEGESGFETIQDAFDNFIEPFVESLIGSL